jgi:precorrin-6B methylase 2
MCIPQTITFLIDVGAGSGSICAIDSVQEVQQRTFTDEVGVARTIRI